MNGGIGGRDVVDISGITVETATVPTRPLVTNPPSAVALNGNVITPGEAYTVPDVQALPALSQMSTKHCSPRADQIR